MRPKLAGRRAVVSLLLPLLFGACSGGKDCEGGGCFQAVSAAASSPAASGSPAAYASDSGFVEQCSDQSGVSSPGKLDAGESLTASGGSIFDGARKAGSASAAPVAAGSGKKCFSGFTAAPARTGLRVRGVPGPRVAEEGVNFALAQSRMREHKALSEVIPGGPIVMEKYYEFQKKAYDTAYGVLDRAGWGARRRRGSDSPHIPVRITVHHTQGHRPMDVAGAAKQANFIQHYHMVGRAQEGKQPFEDIGYHFLIAGDGTVAQGRASNVLGAHAHNANRGNIGISLMGNFNKQQPTAGQMESLKRLVAYTAVKYDINPKQSGALEGHSHYNPTDCPGTNLRSTLARLRQAAYEEMLAMEKRGLHAVESAQNARLPEAARLFPHV